MVAQSWHGMRLMLRTFPKRNMLGYDPYDPESPNNPNAVTLWEDSDEFRFMAGITGFGLPSAEFSTESAPGIDGSYLRGVGVGDREVFIPIYMRAATPGALRAKYRKFMEAVSPFHGRFERRNWEYGTVDPSFRIDSDTGNVTGVDIESKTPRKGAIHVIAETDQTGRRVLYCNYKSGLEGIEGTDANGYYWKRFGIVLTANDPWWYDDSYNLVQFALTPVAQGSEPRSNEPGHIFSDHSFVGPDGGIYGPLPTGAGTFAVPAHDGYIEEGVYYRQFPVGSFADSYTPPVEYVEPHPEVPGDAALVQHPEGSAPPEEEGGEPGPYERARDVWTWTVDEAAIVQEVTYPFSDGLDGTPVLGFVEKVTTYADGAYVQTVGDGSGFRYNAEGEVVETIAAKDLDGETTRGPVLNGAGYPLYTMHYFKQQTPYQVGATYQPLEDDFTIPTYGLSGDGGTDTNNDFLVDNGNVSGVFGLDTTVDLSELPSTVDVWPVIVMLGPASEVSLTTQGGTDVRPFATLPANVALVVYTDPSIRSIYQFNINSNANQDHSPAVLQVGSKVFPLDSDGDSITITARGADDNTRLVMGYQNGYKSAW